MFLKKMATRYVSHNNNSNRYSNTLKHHTSHNHATTSAMKKVAIRSSSSVNDTPTFKPWKVNCVHCNGDYRNEIWLEEHVGGTLYDRQKALPRLPIPDVTTTLERLVPTAVPLIRNEEERVNFQNAVDQFRSQSVQLQERLLQRSNDYSNSSWLQEWWNQLGYLQVRDSNVINVSYFFHFQDDASVYYQNTTVPVNVKRGATMITALSQYRHCIGTGTLPTEVVGKGAKATRLCSTQLKYMFHATRIPQPQQDYVALYDPSQYNHCIVMRHGFFYRLDFCHPQTGMAYPLSAIEKALQQIIQMADNRAKQQKLRLGYFTGINRDNWATARETLLQQGGLEMQEALEQLQSGAFVICFDDTAPVTRAECAEILLHGNAGENNDSDTKMIPQGYNRWFDKSIQIVICQNGKCGLVGEHSMMDGMPTVGLANHITSVSYSQLGNTMTNNTSNDSDICHVREIFTPALIDKINSTPAIHKCIQEAKSEFDELVLQNSLNVQSFYGYGSDFIKEAGFSPDAYVQMAMQLATFRLWGEQVGTYESTQVRPFLHGRTETTRTVSVQSQAFIQRFGLRPLLDENDPAARKEKIRLLQEAVSAHVQYIGLAAKAQGVDRHFFGLSMLVGDNETAPDLYNDPVFQRSKRWRVSTSHLTHRKLVGWGYGQVVPDGVGLAYSIHPRHCIFNITALKHTGWTDQLSHLLEEALLEMRTVVETERLTSSQTPKSKL